MDTLVTALKRAQKIHRSSLWTHRSERENHSLRRGVQPKSREREVVGRVEGNATRTARSPVMELQKQLGQHVPGNPAVSPFHVRKREDHVPPTWSRR